MKPVHFVGTARDDLRELPEPVQESAGFQLFKIQQGKEADDWKPMPTVGSGVQEITVRDASGAYRIFYVAKFEEAVYVLHVFEKRSQKTARTDLELGRADMPICSSGEGRKAYETRHSDERHWEYLSRLGVFGRTVRGTDSEKQFTAGASGDDQGTRLEAGGSGNPTRY
jgi:phage-related protein